MKLWLQPPIKIGSLLMYKFVRQSCTNAELLMSKSDHHRIVEAHQTHFQNHLKHVSQNHRVRVYRIKWDFSTKVAEMTILWCMQKFSHRGLRQLCRRRGWSRYSKHRQRGKALKRRMESRRRAVGHKRQYLNALVLSTTSRRRGWTMNTTYGPFVTKGNHIFNAFGRAGLTRFLSYVMIHACHDSTNVAILRCILDH